jgi:hypothetical protein
LNANKENFNQTKFRPNVHSAYKDDILPSMGQLNVKYVMLEPLLLLEWHQQHVLAAKQVVFRHLVRQGNASLALLVHSLLKLGLPTAHCVTKAGILKRALLRALIVWMV